MFYECNNQKVLACGKHQLNCSANAYDGLTTRKTDLYIVMIEKGPIERTDRLVDSLFRGK